MGGIITNVEHRVSKNGKGWAAFVLEGYEESYEFKIFGEEYLKFRHFLIQNNFTFMRFLVKDGWVNADGRKSDPKIQFLARITSYNVCYTKLLRIVLRMVEGVLMALPWIPLRQLLITRNNFV